MLMKSSDYISRTIVVSSDNQKQAYFAGLITERYFTREICEMDAASLPSLNFDACNDLTKVIVINNCSIDHCRMLQDMESITVVNPLSEIYPQLVCLLNNDITRNELPQDPYFNAKFVIVRI